MEKPDQIIPITVPSITNLEVDRVKEAARLGWGKNHSKYINEFEGKFAEYIGVQYAIATSSCHGALHLVLAGLGIKTGDEVIIPDITWIASAAAVTYVGATPIFVDIDPETWCIDHDSFEKAISSKTKAVMPVTIYGHPPEMDEVMEIAKKHNLYVIEDAAQSVGSKYKNKRPGSFGDCGVFSFHGTKIMTTGEGGMFVTNNPELYEKVKSLSDQGKDPNKLFWNLEIGFKYKMTNIQAALGLAQLERIDDLVSKKRQIFAWYRERLSDKEGMQMNVEKSDVYNTYWMTAIILDKEKYGIEKEELMDKLKKYNIMTRPFFYPLSSMPPLKTEVHNPIAYDLSPYGINLPCGYSITEDEVEYICNSLLEILS